MAFTTLSGSDGITSLVGTTGVDAATLVTLNDNVVVRGNTGNDTLVVNSGTGNNNQSNYDVLMGGGADGVVITDNLLNSFISLDGATLANDGADVFTSAGQNVINSEIVGRGGNDQITLGGTSNSLVNGNSGNDQILGGAAGAGNAIALSAATILGGQGTDVVTIFGIGAGNVINGNRGTDQITLTGTTVSSTTLFGGQGDDTLTLANATIDGNTLSGDLGADGLTGSGSNDILLGGDGADTLTGGVGTDTVTGGAGADTFVFAFGDSVLDSATASTGFDTSDAVFNAATGDIFNVVGNAAGGLTNFGTLNAANIDGANTAVTSLNAAMTAAFNSTAAPTAATGAVDLANNAVGTITVTGLGVGNGTYVVVNDSADGAGYVLGDTVVQVASVANVTVASFI